MVCYSSYIRLSWLLFKVYQTALLIIQSISECLVYYSRYIRLSCLLFKVYQSVLVITQDISDSLGYYSNFITLPWLIFNVPLSWFLFEVQCNVWLLLPFYTHMTDTVKG